MMRELIRNILREEICVTEQRNIKWTEDAIRDVAATYKTKSEFRNKSPRAWEVAKSKGDDFYNSITSHMERPTKYSKDYLRTQAKKYKTKAEFKLNDNPAHLAARSLGKDFFDDITSHMIDGRDTSLRDLKWTDDILKDLTSKYDNYSIFSKENPQAAAALYKRGPEFFNELISHMKKRVNQYSDDDLLQIALKYDNYTDFAENEGGAMASARNRGKDFYDEITKHFKNRPYTYDEVKQIASKYNRIVDLQKNDNRAYNAARRHGWFEDVTSHMIPQMESWNYEKVKEITSKYPTKKEWRDGNGKSYHWALVNLSPEEYDEITSHMESLGNIAHRMIYSFEFPDKTVYVGLTFNSKKRFNQHLKSIKSAVNKHIKETGLTPIFKKHTDYISKEDAIKMEGEIEDQYRQNGWKILNIAKTGALGSSILKWTFDELQKEALKFKTRGEFSNQSPSAYSSAQRQGLLDDITKHMTLLKKYKYTYDQLKDVANKYTSLRDFREYDDGAYQSAKAQGWFDELTSHMSKGKPKDYVYPQQKKTTCPHCGKTGGISNMVRYHFDNCKYK
jgi:predicted GIY-YIG superfamily endonuclease